LLPSFLTEQALRQAEHDCQPAAAMLYFHPWEFDPRQVRLPLGRLTRWRTYAGIYRSRSRLCALLQGRHFERAKDVATQLQRIWSTLPSYRLNPRQAPLRV
jgi:hypothetical protein